MQVSKPECYAAGDGLGGGRVLLAQEVQKLPILQAVDGVQPAGGEHEAVMLGIGVDDAESNSLTYSELQYL